MHKSARQRLIEIIDFALKDHQTTVKAVLEQTGELIAKEAEEEK